MTVDPVAAIIAVGSSAGAVATVWSLLARSRKAFRTSVETTVREAVAEVHARIDGHMAEEEASMERLTDELAGIRQALLSLLEQSGRTVVVLPPSSREVR